MPVIAITGGIGSGKSLALSYLEEAGCPVISMDVIARQITEPGKSAYLEIVEAFGPQVLNPDKSLNRSKLAQRVFDNTQQRQLLETIVHPKIEHTLRQWLATYQQDNNLRTPIFIEIPLLHQRGQFDFIDRILVIESSPKLQLTRVLARDESRSSTDIQNIIGSQISDLERRKIADDILYNSGTQEQFKIDLITLYDQYQSLP
ncbi:Dephospho-CoA kinase [hydrothermal vent metagenome]|uniref:Dephospho-CoA kinase n=1 Tax=hydrothermal vent metagenome TaxID=652676 RepID=A0A3B0Y7D3_9ZZZZ